MKQTPRAGSQAGPPRETRTPPAFDPDLTNLLRTLGRIAREQATRHVPEQPRP